MQKVYNFCTLQDPHAVHFRVILRQLSGVSLRLFCVKCFRKRCAHVLEFEVRVDSLEEQITGYL